MRIISVIFIFVLAMNAGCLEPFTPDLPENSVGILVVEGYINAGHGESIFKLSKATDVNASQIANAERNALIWIVSEENQKFPVKEIQPGVYSSGVLDLPTTSKFRLDITLVNGKQYQSESLPVKITPEIDSVSWEWDDQLYLYVNTHDPLNETHFYRWSYREDWQIQSPVGALLKWDGDTVKQLSVEERAVMRNCWKSSSSRGLIFTSSSAMVKDEIKYNIVTLPLGAEQTSVRYSIIVDQHVLTKEEFDYLTIIEKNTSAHGSFFDPMPSQLYGNIKNLNDSEEIVVGYVGVYTTVRKTLFIERSDIPTVDRGFTCQTKKFEMVSPDSIAKYSSPNRVFEPHTVTLDQYGSPWVSLIERSCVDCRMYGGTAKPSHWN